MESTVNHHETRENHSTRYHQSNRKVSRNQSQMNLRMNALHKAMEQIYTEGQLDTLCAGFNTETVGAMMIDALIEFQDTLSIDEIAKLVIDTLLTANELHMRKV